MDAAEAKIRDEVRKEVWGKNVDAPVPFDNEPSADEIAANEVVEEKLEENTKKIAPTEDENEEEKPAQEDPWEGVNKALREKLDSISSLNEQLLARLKTNEGRIGAIQSELAKKAAEATKRSGQAAPTKEEIDEASKSDEAWSEIKDLYPDWADGLDKKFKQRDKQLERKLSETLSQYAPKDEILSEVKKTREEIANEIRKEFELERLEDAHPDYATVSASPAFWAWVNTQTPDVRERAGSPKARDAIKVLSAYKDSIAAPVTPQADKKKERLARSTSVGGAKETPIKSENDMTDEEYREHIRKKLWRNNK